VEDDDIEFVQDDEKIEVLYDKPENAFELIKLD